MNTKKIFLALLIGAVLGGFAVAQSNEQIDELLIQVPAQAGHGAYLVLTAAGTIPETADPAAALKAAQDAGLLPGGMSPDDSLTFGQFSYLLTASFGVPGGVMYRVFPGPRYAAREVVFRKWSRTRRSPTDKIDGESVVRILSVFLNEEGGAQ